MILSENWTTNKGQTWFAGTEVPNNTFDYDNGAKEFPVLAWGGRCVTAEDQRIARGDE